MRWPPWARELALDTHVSTALLELFALVAFVGALRRRWRFTSCVAFTDSEATRGIVNAGTSTVAALRGLLAHLFRRPEQHLAVRVATHENAWADALSRGGGDGVLLAVGALGWDIVELPFDDVTDAAPLATALSVVPAAAPAADAAA